MSTREPVIATTPASDLTVSVETQPGSMVELSVEAPATELDGAIAASLRRLASRVRVPGFRPGKAPGPIVERVAGWEAVRQEAIEELLPSLYARALAQTGLEPVSEPELTIGEVQRDQPVTFTARVTVRPEVDLRDYVAIRVPEERTEIGEEQVDSAVEEVRRGRADLSDVERPAQAGDVLRCRLVMRRGDEVLSGDAEESRTLELDRDMLVAGLVDGIIGLSAGDERSFSLTLPADYPREELRGSEVTVDVAVELVRERNLPAVDDELAVLDGHGATVAEMREHYRAALVEAAARRDEERYQAAVLRELCDRVGVEVPEILIERDLDRQVGELGFRLAKMGIDLKRYLEMTQSSVEQFRADRRPDSADRVKLELALSAIADAEGIEVDDGQVDREADRLDDEGKATVDQRRRLREVARGDLRRRGAAHRLIEIARGQG